MPHAVRKSRRRSASDAGKRRPCRSPAAHDLGRSTRLGFETKGSVSQVVLGRSLGPGPAFSRCFAAMNASISSTGQRFDRGPRLTGCGISPSRCQRYKVASEICRISITSFRRRSRFSIVQIVIHQDCGLRITARREFVTWAHRPGLRLRDAGFLGSGFGPPQRAVGHAPVPSDRPHRFPTHARMPAPPASVRSRPCPTHAALCWSRVTLDSSFGEGAHRPPTASAAFFFGVGLALVDKREPDRASQRLRDLAEPDEPRCRTVLRSDEGSKWKATRSSGLNDLLVLSRLADPVPAPQLRVARAVRGNGRLVRRQRLAAQAGAGLFVVLQDLLPFDSTEWRTRTSGEVDHARSAGQATSRAGTKLLVSQQNYTRRHEPFRRNETDAIVVCQSPATAWTCSQTFGGSSCGSREKR